jgi:hypothetical protein
MKPAKIISVVLLFTFSLSLLYYLRWHWQLGLIRYFDVDEYAHLHWAAQILMGKKPYIDFLTFFPPGFAWFLTPAILAGWGTAQPFITARVMMFLVFMGICATSGLIFWQLRKSVWGAVAAAMFLAFLPMPFDKYLEIRPDNLATLLILIAVYFQIIWMDGDPVALLGRHSARATPISLRINNLTMWNQIISGLAYALSYLVLPKMLPNIAPGMGIAAIYLFQNRNIRSKVDQIAALNQSKPFLIGFGVPLFLFGLWALTLGNPGTVIYSLTSLTLESNKISQYFIMVPFLFFYPNATFYGQDGWSRGLLINHFIWEVGLMFAVYRLMTPFLTGDRKRVLAEILVAANGLVQVVFYVVIVPLKHTQYLIPIGVFVAWYFADLLVSVFRSSGKFRYGKIITAGLFIIAAVFLSRVFLEVNSVKQYWTNTQPLNEITALYKRIPASEPIFDMDGRMLFNPDPYYACCIPFGQFAGFLSHPLPDLPQALAKGNVKYINQGELQRVNTLPSAWQQYIYSHYRSDSGNNSLLIRNDIN